MAVLVLLETPVLSSMASNHTPLHEVHAIPNFYLSEADCVVSCKNDAWPLHYPCFQHFVLFSPWAVKARPSFDRPLMM